MAHSEEVRPLFEIGWREWIALPDLGIPAIKVKTDTGARTSALHTFSQEAFVDRGVARIRFGVYPLQRRDDIEVFCEADVVDFRNVRNSGGELEKRYVIGTELRVGNWEWPIEVTLASRENLNFRMLLGRNALGNRALIHPGRSYLLGKPESMKALHDIYRAGANKENQ
jgi:hypothetical protein